MNGSDLIQAYDQVLPLELCEGLILNHQFLERQGQALSDLSEYPHTTAFEGQATHTALTTRSDLVFPLEDLLVEIIQSYLRECLMRDPVTMEVVDHEVVVQRHRADQGVPQPHFTHCEDEAGFCLGVVGYLNTLDKKGETVFPFQNHRISGRQGQVAIFPLTEHYFHHGPEPIGEDKYLVVAYYRLVPRQR